MNAWVHILVLFLMSVISGSSGLGVGLREASAPDPSGPEASAHRIVARAIEEHGGLQAWRHKKDVSFSTTWTHYRDGRGRFSSRYRVMFPTTTGPRRVVIEAQENGKPVVMGVSGSRSWFVVGGEARDDMESLQANRAFVKKAHALLALPFMLDDPAYRLVHDGQEVRGGREVERVRVEHGLEAPLVLLFDRASGRLAGAGSVVSDRPTTTLGDAHDFEQVDGILVPFSQTYDRVNPSTGAVSRVLEVTVESVRFDNGFRSDTFEPPSIP